ncbi:hypothetical protein UFOVP123_25 [uncultured Caudovirales phage]|uniref:Uncharacterized protein n=1 Tax=uncultured Caudovirales phage TaxID=2100421 RepID=A0A6J5LCL9_9CAUD|nr:hypothetical protein UFOVP123_25 [uncultured Caudovirales phage]
MDPLTILAMANAAVAAVKKGCQLYKDVKGAAGDVKEVLADLNSQFAGKKVSKEQKAVYDAEVQRVKDIGASNPDQVISQIGEQLGTFFDAFDQIENLFWEEERNAKKIYTGDVSLSRRALQRVLIRTRLAQMHAEIRQEMCWNTPAELGDLWTRFEEMRKQVEEEQATAREEQRKKDLEVAWQRQQRLDLWRSRAGDLFLVAFLAIYVWGLMWSVKIHRENLDSFLS